MEGSSQADVAVESTRSGAGLVLVGAGILAAQNAILFGAFIFALAVDIPQGFQWATVSLLVDVPGVAVLGAGLWTMASRLGASRLSGVLCFVWIGLTVTWRWILPALAGSEYEDILLTLWGSDGETPVGLLGMQLPVAAMLLSWIAASALFLAVPLVLRHKSGWAVGQTLLEDRVGPRSWEGFVATNATGTFLVAGGLLAILGGAAVGWPLQAGVVIKVALAPAGGAFAYVYLGWRASKAMPRAHRMAGTSPMEESAPDPDGPPGKQGG